MPMSWRRFDRLVRHLVLDQFSECQLNSSDYDSGPASTSPLVIRGAMKDKGGVALAAGIISGVDLSTQPRSDAR